MKKKRRGQTHFRPVLSACISKISQNLYVSPKEASPFIPNPNSA